MISLFHDPLACVIATVVAILVFAMIVTFIVGALQGAKGGDEIAWRMIQDLREQQNKDKKNG